VRVVDSAAARPSVVTAGDVGFRVGDMGTGWGSPLTITQRPDSLILEYVFFSTYDLQPPVRLAFAMDGTPTPIRVMIGHATSERMGMVRWGEDFTTLRLVEIFETAPGVGAIPGQATRTLTVIHALTLTSPTTLEISTTRSATAGVAPSTITTTYSRR
jgi:hypothetical protein